MKAIETQYKGYLFRSRLEARWAVFLDELGIEWLYELEGFELDNGMWYLPDFYLPKFLGRDLWLEIKPTVPDPDSDDVKKIVAFQKAIYPKSAIAVGLGDQDNGFWTLTQLHENNGEISFGISFLGYLNDELALFVNSEYPIYIFTKNATIEITEESIENENIDADIYLSILANVMLSHPRIEAARVKAKSARFER